MLPNSYEHKHGVRSNTQKIAIHKYYSPPSETTANYWSKEYLSSLSSSGHIVWEENRRDDMERLLENVADVVLNLSILCEDDAWVIFVAHESTKLLFVYALVLGESVFICSEECCLFGNEHFLVRRDWQGKCFFFCKRRIVMHLGLVTTYRPNLCYNWIESCIFSNLPRKTISISTTNSVMPYRYCQHIIFNQIVISPCVKNRLSIQLVYRKFNVFDRVSITCLI